MIRAAIWFVSSGEGFLLDRLGMTALCQTRMGTATIGRGALLASLAAAIACGHGSRVDIHGLDDSIRQELPLGTPRSAVVAFLDGHTVRHSDSPNRRTVLAGVTDHRWRWSWACGQTDAHFTFEFDESDHLTRYEMREVPICF